MKNIPELSCAIVEDLLPTYVERLTSEETNMAVEAHLASCPACAAKRTAMGAKETEAAGQNAEETAREVDYLKKVRRRNRRRVWLAVACTTLVLAAVILTKIFIIGGPGQANDVGVRLVEIVDGDTLSVNVDCLYAVNAFYGWEQDETEDGVVSFTAREARASFIHPNDLVDLRVPLEGLKEVRVCDRLVWQNGTTILESTLWIYDARTPYVGDATAVGNLVHEIGLWLSSMELPYNYTISLQTTSEPYGLTIHFDSVTAHVLGVERDIDKRMYATAPTLLALIGNLEQVQWTYAAPDGTTVTRSVTLEEVDQALPDWIEARNLAYHQDNSEDGTDWIAPESVKDYAASPAALQQLLDLTCHGFYVVTEEDGTTIFTPQF